MKVWWQVQSEIKDTFPCINHMILHTSLKFETFREMTIRLVNIFRDNDTIYRVWKGGDPDPAFLLLFRKNPVYPARFSLVSRFSFPEKYIKKSNFYES